MAAGDKVNSIALFQFPSGAVANGVSFESTLSAETEDTTLVGDTAARSEPVINERSGQFEIFATVSDPIYAEIKAAWAAQTLIVVTEHDVEPSGSSDTYNAVIKQIQKRSTARKKNRITVQLERSGPDA